MIATSRSSRYLRIRLIMAFQFDVPRDHMLPVAARTSVSASSSSRSQVPTMCPRASPAPGRTFRGLRQLRRDHDDAQSLARKFEGEGSTAAFEPMSMPFVGSSRMMTFGLVASHLPITTFCWFPRRTTCRRGLRAPRREGRASRHSAGRARIPPPGAGSRHASSCRGSPWRCSGKSASAARCHAVHVPRAHRRCRQRWHRPASG